MQIVESTKKVKNHKSKAEIEELIKKMRKEDDKMVKGKFEFVEAGAGTFEFTYRFYPGQLFSKITINHGEFCELPLGIVKHLNNTYIKVRQYANVEQPASGPISTPTTFVTNSRVRFVPIEFI